MKCNKKESSLNVFRLFPNKQHITCKFHGFTTVSVAKPWFIYGYHGLTIETHHIVPKQHITLVVRYIFHSLKRTKLSESFSWELIDTGFVICLFICSVLIRVFCLGIGL